MDSEALKQLILAGEGPQVEYKERFSPELDREMVALANGGGGTILLGVADDSTVIGLTKSPEEIQGRVMELCSGNIRPTLLPATTILPLDEGTVLAVTVQEGGQKPYTTNGVCYVRAGSTSRRARPEELRAFTFEADYARFERVVVAGSTFEDLNLARFQDYVDRRAMGIIRVHGPRLLDVAVSWGIAVRQSGQVLPTVAGLLLFGYHPQALHAHWGMGAVRLAGDSLTDAILDRADLEGPVNVLVDEAMAFVRRNLRVAALFSAETSVRQDVPEYPVAAVREALANAVVHRDYGVPSRVMLRMFEDRLEIVSPGGLPRDLTLEDVLSPEGVSYLRNPIVARVMRDWGWMEEMGRGLLRIKQEMTRLDSPSPIFESTRQKFRVVLPSWHRELDLAS